MQYQNRAGQYRRLHIETAGKLDLILMCYEKAIEMLRQAKVHFEGKEYEKKGRRMQKALEIIHELQSCLNFERGGEVARNLDSLYSYMTRRLIQGDVNKDLGAYDEVIRILSELKEGWEGIAETKEKELNGTGQKVQAALNLQLAAA
jgi:flagellar protein FliS